MAIAIPTFPEFPPGRMMWGHLAGKFAHDTRTRERTNITDEQRAFANKYEGLFGSSIPREIETWKRAIAPEKRTDGRYETRRRGAEKRDTDKRDGVDAKRKTRIG